MVLLLSTAENVAKKVVKNVSKIEFFEHFGLKIAKTL